MRRQFLARLKRKFRRLRLEVIDLIRDEDALGIDVRNAFCPTGEGGGVDPSCGSSTGKQSAEKAMAAGEHGKALKAAYENHRDFTYPEINDLVDKITGPMKRAESQALAKEFGIAKPLSSKSAAVAEIKRKIMERKGSWERTQFRATNAFCPTGEGGGIDPSCSPGSGMAAKLGAVIDKVPVIGKIKRGMTGVMKSIHGRLEKRYGSKAATAIMTSGAIGGYAVAAGAFALTGVPGVPIVNDLISIAAHTALAEIGLQASRLAKRFTGNASSQEVWQEIQDYLATMIEEYRSELEQIQDGPEIRELIAEFKNQSLVANDRWRFLTSPEKVKAFQEWLKTQMQQIIRSEDDEELWRAYIEQGFRKGAGRAFDDVRQSELKKRRPELFTPEAQREGMGFFAGTRDEFLRQSFARPVSVERVKLLAGRAFDDLENITSDMAAKMTRALTDGLIEGKHSLEVASDLAEQVDLTYSRAELIARTELTRAHAQGQLQAMEEMGVAEVGVAVEWAPANDDAVCSKCEPLEGVVLSLAEAQNLLPRHPRCRCVFLPANTGEDTENQKDTKKEIERAIRESTEGGDEWGPPSVSKERPQSIFNQRMQLPFALLEFSRFVGNMSYFADCERDPKGRCLPSGKGEQGYATSAVQEASVKVARAKIKNAPVPSKEAAAKAREELARAKAEGSRPGGESRGGGSKDRQRQRLNLFKEFGGETKGYVACPWTGLKMHWTDDPKENPNGYPKFERGKIFTKAQGGGYQIPNLIPESFAANRSRNDRPMRKENLK